LVGCAVLSFTKFYNVGCIIKHDRFIISNKNLD
jgi:hypothetical protein